MPEDKGKPPKKDGPGRTERRGIPSSKSGKILKKDGGGWVTKKPGKPGDGPTKK